LLVSVLVVYSTYKKKNVAFVFLNLAHFTYDVLQFYPFTHLSFFRVSSVCSSTLGIGVIPMDKAFSSSLSPGAAHQVLCVIRLFPWPE
jgi:hypothetical protein